MGRHPKKSSSSHLEVGFGRVLREIRENRGLSQEALGEESGYHRTYVGLLERGEYRPSLEALFLLGQALAVRPSEIVARVETVLAGRPVARHRRGYRPRRAIKE